MCYGILEVTYKEDTRERAEDEKMFFPKTEKEFNLKLNELRASEATIKISVFPRTKVYIKKVIWDESV